MKVKTDKKNTFAEEQISFKERREIERALGVYLSKPQNVQRTNSEQYGVYDEKEVFAGDIIADGDYFDHTELVRKIKELFA